MLVDDFTRNPYALSHQYPSDEAKFFLYFDHSDDPLDNTLSIKTETSFPPEPSNTLSLTRSSYLSIIQKQYCSPKEKRKLMERFIKNQRNLRRQRAKERVRLRGSVKEECVGVKMEGDVEERGQVENRFESERRRKRVSAQISRDKKKSYLKKMEEENLGMRSQLLKIMKEKNNLLEELRMYRNRYQCVGEGGRLI